MYYLTYRYPGLKYDWFRNICDVVDGSNRVTESTGCHQAHRHHRAGRDLAVRRNQLRSQTRESFATSGPSHPPPPPPGIWCQSSSLGLPHISASLGLDNWGSFFFQIYKWLLKSFVTLLNWFLYWFSGAVENGNNLLKCGECCRNFKSKAALVRHSHVHDVQRPFLCHCGQSYKRYKHLERHLLAQHNTVIRQTEDQVLVAVCTDEAPQHFIDIAQQEPAGS